LVSTSVFAPGAFIRDIGPARTIHVTPARTFAAMQHSIELLCTEVAPIVRQRLAQREPVRFGDQSKSSRPFEPFI
jgi:hypothetical protein